MRSAARSSSQCATAPPATADENISFEIKPRHKKKLLVARKIRGYDKKLKFKPWGGTMSYYTTDRLSDKELRDIIAYLR